MNRKADEFPPIEVLRRYFRIDSEWRIERRIARHGWKRVSKIRAGNKYASVCFEGKKHPVHRMIWALHYGEQPPEVVDHINNKPWDNRIENLRAATQAQNRWNVVEQSPNATGYSGVRRSATGFYAVVYANYRRHASPIFDDAELAGLAAHELRRKHRGQFMPGEA